MSLEHAILGFLSFEPLSGYDLKKQFDRSVRHFWPANQSQIYRTLARMTEDRLLEKEIVEREERLDMKIYRISEKGRQELHRWLTAPLPKQDSREPFLIQVFFGCFLSDEEMLNLLRQEERAQQEKLAVYTQICKDSMVWAEQSEDHRAFFLNMLTLDYGLRDCQTTLAWLKDAIQRIEAKDYTSLPFDNGK
jgi:PadR family transcriptional regulator, regulatory protein AphA